MPGNNFSQLLSKKAYEISYAAFRVATASKKRSFMEHLERQALSFLASAVREDYAVAKEASVAIEYLLRLGGDVGFVNQTNIQSISAEIQVFNAAIAESQKSANPEAIDLSDIFSKMPVSISQNISRHESISEDRSTSEEVSGHHRESEVPNSNGNGHAVVKSAMRQSAILERIRQNGDCRLKEIQEVLPEASERTIRYDLQNLLEQGLVERIGNGGPATFYRAKG